MAYLKLNVKSRLTSYIKNNPMHRPFCYNILRVLPLLLHLKNILYTSIPTLLSNVRFTNIFGKAYMEYTCELMSSILLFAPICDFFSSTQSVNFTFYFQLFDLIFVTYDGIYAICSAIPLWFKLNAFNLIY